MFCKYCGNQIDNDSLFCTICGGKLNGRKTLEKETDKQIKSVKEHSRNSNVLKEISAQNPNLTKGIKIILFLFFSFLVTGLFLTIKNSTNIPVLWFIPFAVVLIYQIMFRTQKKMDEKRAKEQIRSKDKEIRKVPIKTKEEIKKEQIENEKTNKIINRLAIFALIFFIVIIFILALL